jgi:hypothetical protein
MNPERQNIKPEDEYMDIEDLVSQPFAIGTVVPDDPRRSRPGRRPSSHDLFYHLQRFLVASSPSLAVSAIGES